MGLIIALALPLARIVPPLHTFRIRSHVFRWCAELRDIEQQHETGGSGSVPALLEQLDAMESKVEKVVVPLSYTDELCALRSNIGLVRKKLLRKVEALRAWVSSARCCRALGRPPNRARRPPPRATPLHAAGRRVAADPDQSG